MAYTAYEQALDVNPDNPEARQRARLGARIRGETPEEVVPLLEPFVKNDPPTPRPCCSFASPRSAPSCAKQACLAAAATPA